MILNKVIRDQLLSNSEGFRVSAISALSGVFKSSALSIHMDSKGSNSVPQLCGKVNLCLGSEQYDFSVSHQDRLLSDMLVELKEQCMSTFKDYLVRHNAPADVPDDVQESSSEEDDPKPSKLLERTKKRK
ncbi:hypothetical protein SUGI_0934350 [Cryptomeria japonica]|nr:hypothetical protein SUGI_0934350 [Cryptomeria japonica]